MVKDPYLNSGYYNATLNNPSQKYKTTELFFKRHNVKRVLDFGCGAGRHTLLLAKAGFSTYGFDNSFWALKTARSLLREKGLQAKLIRCDMRGRLPYKDGFFDAVFASRVMYQARVKDIKKSIGEVSRILKDNGYLFWSGPTMETLKILSQNEPRESIEPGTTAALEGPFKGIPYHCFSSKEEVAGMLNGFRIIRFDFRGATFYLLAQKRVRLNQ
ncbi:MAG: class I SAM-dependent methyltransferase [Candidatus Marsarchaeota archaeon]|jgi:ubiquinone/menaquinone biosynthesis C-methylase UbiE|nr:class I SAM-dependent methyltransferase [Candidatus Marsarchaeota archaeon]MCL5112781.1 class I SAM-dependent methyltransferase [Candidatus Marsarchaeota archaeon]